MSLVTPAAKIFFRWVVQVIIRETQHEMEGEGPFQRASFNTIIMRPHSGGRAFPRRWPHNCVIKPTFKKSDTKEHLLNFP